MIRKLTKFFTEDQMIALASAPDPRTLLGARDRAILGLLCASAVRASELCSLTIDDLKPTRVFVRAGKFGHQRWAPISRRCWLAVQRYLALQPAPAGGPLFRTAQGRPLTRRQLHKIVTQHQRAVRLPACGVHVLRSSAATRFLNRGLNLRTVQIILGHAWIATTSRYLGVAMDHPGRDAGYPAPPGQIRTGPFRAYGSHLG